MVPHFSMLDPCTLSGVYSLNLEREAVMASRLCGYCRQDGHRADKCGEKAGVRTAILTHMPKERKFVLDTMVKNGWGEGATFVLLDWYANKTRTYVLTGADFIKRWNFGAQKRLKYSKQLRFTPMSPIEKTLDGQIADLKYQYDHISINALCFGDGASEMREVRLASRAILSPAMFDGNNLDNREPKLIEASFQPFDIDPALYAKDVIVHRRVASDLSRRTSNWDDTYYETGIIPV